MQIYDFFVAQENFDWKTLRNETVRVAAYDVTSVLKISNVKKKNGFWYVTSKLSDNKGSCETDLVYDPSYSRILNFFPSTMRAGALRCLEHLIGKKIEAQIGEQPDSQCTHRILHTDVKFAEKLVKKITSLSSGKNKNILTNPRITFFEKGYELGGLFGKEKMSSLSTTFADGKCFTLIGKEEYQDILDNASLYRPCFQIHRCIGLTSNEKENYDVNPRILRLSASQNYWGNGNLPVDDWVNFYEDILQHIFKL